LLAVIVALPISIFTALFITKIAPKNLRTPFFIVLSLLAAIPSVVYGAFGSFVVD
jgi:ABC-type phosphate transport system permease subunit